MLKAFENQNYKIGERSPMGKLCGCTSQSSYKMWWSSILCEFPLEDSTEEKAHDKLSYICQSLTWFLCPRDGINLQGFFFLSLCITDLTTTTVEFTTVSCQDLNSKTFPSKISQQEASGLYINSPNTEETNSSWEANIGILNLDLPFLPCQYFHKLLHTWIY